MEQIKIEQIHMEQIHNEASDALSSPGGPIIAYLGLGASLGDRRDRIQQALNRLHAPDMGVRVSRISSLFESPHMGLQPEDEIRFPRHFNAVAEIVTSLAPDALLAHIQNIEDAGGRQRGIRWDPRTIDIDILDYDRQRIETDRLTLPHPGIAHRAFVVLPWAEIAPDFRLGDGPSIAELAATDVIINQEIERLDQPLRLPFERLVND